MLRISGCTLPRRGLVFSVLCAATVLFRPTPAQAVRPEAPTIVCPLNILASNAVGQCSAAVSFSPTATGVPDPIVVCTPASGSVFPVGTNSVSCSASNKSGVATCSFAVVVQDVEAPAITCPTNILVECAGFSGTSVPFAPVVTDNCPGAVGVCSPPSGASFAVGVNTVNCVATDAAGNTNSCSFTVTVQDTIPPMITCPANINAAEFPHDLGFAHVPFAPVAVDICDSAVAVVCSPPSGSSFGLGYTTVNCVATDASGNTNACSFVVRVIPYRLPVTSANDTGPGTLRQALLDANDAPGESRVEFRLPGSGLQTLAVLSALPPVTSPVIIDGWTQDGFSGEPVIELDGSANGGTDGLVIAASDSTVRGLILHGFATGIRLDGTGGNTIQGNYIGLDATGTNAPGNSGDGLYVTSPRNLIGGTVSALRNLISGNTGNGVHFDTTNAFNNLVRGNYFGLAIDRSSPLPNGQNGVLFSNGAAQNKIGGTTNGAGNSIAYNGLNGVALDASAGAGNSLRGNSIFSHSGLGIDLGVDGVTANDPADADEGPNRLQNFPVLTDVRSVQGITSIDGTLASAPLKAFQLEFFLNDATNSSGYGEGQVFLGSAVIGTDQDGNQTFTVPFALTATVDQFVTATATDFDGNSSEFCQALRVRTPPVLQKHPGNTNAPTGTPVTLCAAATGTPPFSWQWRLNGANIPGATNPCYTIPSAQVANGGTYTVLVGNVLGVQVTVPATLTLPLPDLNGADNFADRVSLSDVTGLISGSNISATREPGELDHAGKPGGKSVWYSWVPAVTGIATVGTTGSTFDTLLEVYTGSALSNLVTVASDEDGGGFFASGLRFNAIQGTEYQIVVDGYYGAEGEFDFGWQEENTSHLLPLISLQPQSQTVAPGDTVTFISLGQRVCGSGHSDCPDPDHYPNGDVPLITYQWFFNDTAIPGAIAATLTVTNVTSSAVGNYTVQVTQQDPTHPRTVESRAASLQINLTDATVEGILAFDKFEDAANAEPLRLGEAPASSNAVRGFAPASVVRGYTGTQVFNTAGSSTQTGEEPICNVIGGASQWISFLPDASGVLFLNTSGSSYETVMAVFVRSTTNAGLSQVACNHGTNGQPSSLNVPVQIGKTNYIVIDGVNGATGVLQLNYSMGTPVTITMLAATHFQVNTRPAQNFTIQRSTDLKHWSSILTTNSANGLFDFVDNTLPPDPNRYYRALLLP